MGKRNDIDDPGGRSCAGRLVARAKHHRVCGHGLRQAPGQTEQAQSAGTNVVYMGGCRRSARDLDCDEVEAAQNPTQFVSFRRACVAFAEYRGVRGTVLCIPALEPGRKRKSKQGV